MSTSKNPAYFTAMSGASGLNLRIDQMARAFNSVLNNPTPVFRIFHQVDRKQHQDGRIYPAAYNENGVDELDLTPEDQWPYVFFEIGQPYEVDPDGDYMSQRGVYPRITVDVSIISYMNIDKLFNYGKWGHDYRLTREAMREAMLDVCLRHFNSVQGVYVVKSIFDRELEDIFKGYGFKESDRQYLQQPFYAIRIEGTLTYKESC